jgi:hypothetical protein
MAGKAPQSIYSKQGENIFAKNPKVSAELLALTYGAFVHRLIKEDTSSGLTSNVSSGENADEVNSILDKMGYNIGCRIIDEFFAKAPS